MALFKSRNQMGANKNNNQAQMLMMLNQVTNLENQLRMGSVPQNQNMGMDSSNLLNIVSQLKSIQGNLPGASRRNAPKAPVMRIPNGVPNHAASLAGLLQSMSGGNGIMDRSPCVWVTGLPEEYQDADKLINIFGNFGNVIRIKFTEKKPDGALIEMDDPRGAFKCITCLNKKKLGGQEISVAGTKLEAAYIKKEDTKSKDFRRARENWRFAKDKDGKFRRIVCGRLKKLSPKVIVTNLPEGKSDALKKYIIEAGYTVKSIQGSQRPEDKEKKNTGYTMAAVELASVEEAIGAVAYLHNTWPAKFGTKKEDRFGNARGLVFSLAGTIPEKPKA